MINLHIVLNDYHNDSRVLKETETVSRSDLFDEVHVVALNDGNSPMVEYIRNVRVWRIKLVSRKLSKLLFVQILKYLEFLLRVVFHYLSKQVIAVHCHDLNALPVGVLLKLIHPKIKVIYDAHELQSEHSSYSTKRLRKMLFVATERRLIPFVNRSITVCTSIAEWYQKNLNVKMVVIRNVPFKKQVSPENLGIDLKKHFKVATDSVLYIYQGALSRGRGIETLLDVFRVLSDTKQIVFMGNGPLKPKIMQFSKNHKNIHCLDAVPMHLVVQTVASADIGLSLIEDICLSYRFALPNKVFEQLQAGIPVLASSLPEQKLLIEKYNAGWLIDNSTCDYIKELKLLINSITPEDIYKKRVSVRTAQQELTWENEEQILINLYNCLTDK